MAKSLETWKTQVFNKTIDLDNQSYDCVDVSKSWAEYLTDKAWTTSLAWGNAKDLYGNTSETYWSHIPVGNAPQVGDIVVMNGQIGGGYGHTGVVVGVAGQNITIYQQNTFTQQPVYTGIYNGYVSYITGYLRPKVAFTTGAAPLEGYQRIAAYAAKYRDAPNGAATLLQTFVSGETYDFKGFVHGENVDNNDAWFVGRYTGGYAWSGAFTDTGTHDLDDLTAPVTLEKYQRQVGNSVINYRTEPKIMPDNVIKTFNPGEVLDFDGWTRGALVDGSDIWFHGKYTGGWSHAGGFTDRTAHDLPELNIIVAPVPAEPAVDLSKKVLDLSSNNKITDYPALKAAVRGVVAKAGHTGKSYSGVQPLNSDPDFAITKTALAEKLVGAYWYAYCSLDPEVEAQAFVTTVGAVPAAFTYWLDIEESDGKTNAQVNAWCKKFCDKVDSLTNKVTGQYMNENWYNNVITAATKGSRPIWLAHYDIAENTNIVTNQVAHQYTSKGTVAGVSGYVDVNVVTDAFFVPTVIVPPVDPVDPTDPTPVDPTPVPEPDDPTKSPFFAIFEAIVKFLTDVIHKLKKK